MLLASLALGLQLPLWPATTFPRAGPPLLTAAPLLTLCVAWSHFAAPLAAAASPGSLKAHITARLPWVLLIGIAFTEGLPSALPGLLGIGGGMVIGPLFLTIGMQPQVNTAAAASDE